MTMGATLVFVYGTLKRGLCNHGWLRGQVFAGAARTQPRYLMHDLGGYPGMTKIAVPGQGLSIEGEVWEVTDSCLQELHRLEGVDAGEYEFVEIALCPPWDGRPVLGYLYLRPVGQKPDAGTCWTDL